MGEVVHVNFGESRYSAEVQNVLSRRIRAKLDQLYPERWERAERIAAQVVADMQGFDKRISFTIAIEPPIGADGQYSEQAFKKTAEKLREDVTALVNELRKAAHLSIAATAYSTVINVAAPENMLA
jgi:hypothetical protein